MYINYIIYAYIKIHYIADFKNRDDYIQILYIKQVIPKLVLSYIIILLSCKGSVLYYYYNCKILYTFYIRDSNINKLTKALDYSK